MYKRLLIVEDEETLCESLKRVLSREGYAVTTVNSAEAALALPDKMYDLIITDIILPGINGIELIKRIKENNPEQLIVVMTAYASLETAVESLRAGAYDYIVKPVMHEEIKQIVKNAINQKALQKENLLLKCQLESQYDIETITIYKSAAMQDIFNSLKKIADDKGNLILSGETGTEKELLAKMQHIISQTNKPFIPIACNSTDINMLQRFYDNADVGVLFINNILCLNNELQAMLLKLLEDKDVMTITATDKDIGPLVQEGRFSRALFQKINGSTVKIPPLRERREDIQPLANYFVQKYSEEFCKKVKLSDSDTLELLRNYDWPGNIRELRSVIERAVLIADGEVIRAEHLPLN